MSDKAKSVLWSLFYYTFCALLCLPAVVLLFGGVLWADARVSALLPQRTRAEEWQLTLNALKIAGPGIILEFLLFWAWATRRERRRKRGER